MWEGERVGQGRVERVRLQRLLEFDGWRVEVGGEERLYSALYRAFGYSAWVEACFVRTF